MPIFSTAHLLMLALTVVLTVMVVPAGRWLRRSGLEDRVLPGLGWVLLAVTVAWTGFWLLPARFDVNESLPLHLSDVLRVVTAVALITRARWAIALTYYWGLTLNLQSILTPDLNFFQLPVLEFILYWFLHLVTWLVPVGLTWGLGYRPTWRGFFLTYLLTFLWAGSALLVNLVTGANYGYLSRAPAGGSALDFFGPWPWYLGTVAVILAVGWALITWPWGYSRSHDGTKRQPSLRAEDTRRQACGR